MPLQSDSLIVEVEIWDLCLPVAHMIVCTMIYMWRVPLAGYILLMTPQLEVLKHLGHANFDDNRSEGLKRFFHLLLFGMMVGIVEISLVPRLSCAEEATCTHVQTIQILLGLPFSPQRTGTIPWWMSLTLCFGWWSCIRQTKPTTAQIVFSVMHREGSGGFAEGLCVCGIHPEKLIASFRKRTQV